MIAAGWTLFAVFFAGESVVSRAYLGRPLRMAEALGSWLLCALTWLAATPFLLMLSRRFPLERRAVATVRQEFSRMQLVAGQLRKVETSVTQDETWVRTNEGWKLKFVITNETHCGLLMGSELSQANRMTPRAAV